MAQINGNPYFHNEEFEIFSHNVYVIKKAKRKTLYLYTFFIMVKLKSFFLT